MKQFKNSLKSRKLWLAIIAAGVGFGNSYFNWGLTTQEVWMTIAPLLTYIGVEGAIDIKEAK